MAIVMTPQKSTSIPVLCHLRGWRHAGSSKNVSFQSHICPSTRFAELTQKMLPLKEKPGECVVCGKELTGSRTRYCGHQCYRRFYLAKPTAPAQAVCPICGRSFAKGRASQVYCSKRCKYLAKNRAAASLRKQRDRSHKEIISTGEPVICNRCGHNFLSWDKTRNRRCLKCQQQVEHLHRGAENSHLEGIID